MRFTEDDPLANRAKLFVHIWPAVNPKLILTSFTNPCTC